VLDDPPPRRSRLPLIVRIVVLLWPVITLVVLAYTAQRLISPGRNLTPTGRQTHFDGAVLPAGVRAADFRLHDQRGRLVTMRTYRGRAVVVTFMYSTCPDVCPLTAQQIRGALNLLGRPVPVLAISVDPVGDTPAHVRAFLTRQHMAGRMRYLTGTSAQLAPVWRAYGIQPQTAASTHTADTVLVDARGRQRVGFLSSQLTPEALAHDLRELGDGARATY
jgi:protein SCO1